MNKPVYGPLKGMRNEERDYKPFLKKYGLPIAFFSLISAVGLVYELNKMSENSITVPQTRSTQPIINTQPKGRKNLETRIASIPNLNIQINGTERILVYNSVKNRYEFKK
jgi:hypothetical protein